MMRECELNALHLFLVAPQNSNLLIAFQHTAGTLFLAENLVKTLTLLGLKLRCHWIKIAASNFCATFKCEARETSIWMSAINQVLSLQNGGAPFSLRLKILTFVFL